MSTALSIASSAAKAVIIKVTSGPNKGDNYKVVAPGVIIGRDPSVCKIVVDDQKVSRQQCRIDFRPNGITLEDLSGKGTTLVNDQISEYVTLQNNDYIHIGDSRLSFEILDNHPDSSNSAPEPKLKAATFSQSSAKQIDNKKSNVPKIIIGIFVVLIIAFFLYPTKKKTPTATVTTEDEKDLAIEAVIKRQEELSAKESKLTKREIYNKRKAQEHYIRGFRDYQNHKYNRAIEAFQTSLATDPSHKTARRYYKLAQKKQEDVVDYHMDLGNKYKQKSMYKLCIAQFGKVLQIINQPNNKKYKMAKEQIKECRLSKQRRF